MKLGISQKVVSTTRNRDINLKKGHKSWVHKLLPRHIAERHTNSRKLYECHLAGDKWKLIVTLDEAYVYLNDTNKPRAIFYQPRSVKIFKIGIQNAEKVFQRASGSLQDFATMAS